MVFLTLKNDKHFLGVHCLQDNIEMFVEQGGIIVIEGVIWNIVWDQKITCPRYVLVWQAKD